MNRPNRPGQVPNKSELLRNNALDTPNGKDRIECKTPNQRPRTKYQSTLLELKEAIMTTSESARFLPKMRRERNGLAKLFPGIRGEMHLCLVMCVGRVVGSASALSYAEERSHSNTDSISLRPLSELIMEFVYIPLEFQKLQRNTETLSHSQDHICPP